eukprot:39707_1
MLPLLLLSITHIHVIISQYIPQSQLLSWADHEALCLWRYDTNLASIHNISQDNAADVLRGTHDCWIGLNSLSGQTTDDFTWSDQSPFDYGTDLSGGIDPWNTGQPGVRSTSDEFCVELQDIDGDWNDNQCDRDNSALCNEPSPIYIFRDNDNYQRVPIKGNIIGVIDILDEIKIKFRFILNSWSNNQWTSVFALEDKDIEIYIDNIAHLLYIEIDTVAHDQREYTYNITTANEYTFEILFTQTRFQFKSNNTVVFDDVIESHTIVMDANVYLSYFGSFDAADAILTAFTMSTSNTHFPTPYNYLCDFNNRFTTVTGTWNYNSTNCEVTSVNTGLGNVVWMGDKDPQSLTWTDYKAEIVFIMPVGGKAGILIRSMSVAPENNGGEQYEFGVKSSTDQVRMGEIYMGDWTERHNQDKIIDANIEYTLRVEAVGNKFYCYLNNEYVFQKEDLSYDSGTIGLRTHNTNDTVFKSIRITFPTDGYLLTVDPTYAPTTAPSNYPSISPSINPTNIPSQPPSISPSLSPTLSPTNAPLQTPSIAPSVPPTTNTKAPSVNPSLFPSKMPTQSEGQIDIKSTMESSEDNQGLDDTDKNGKININQIIILVVVLSGIILIVILGIYCYKKKKERHMEVIELGSTEIDGNGHVTNVIETNIVHSEDSHHDHDEEANGLYDTEFNSENITSDGNIDGVDVMTPNGIIHSMEQINNNQDTDLQPNNEDEGEEELYVNNNANDDIETSQYTTGQ